VRRESEEEARLLLNRKAGDFSLTDLEAFLDHCNREIVPPDLSSNICRQKITLTRFQLSFIGQNRQLMKRSLVACNYWINRLWRSDSDPLVELSRFWSKNEVLGAGMGLPTFILYLKNPDVYNIWTPFLNSACSLFTGHELSSRRDAKNYSLYNKAVNSELREPFHLDPQEIDYILYRIKASGLIV
jgi:hypothetical protein